MCYYVGIESLAVGALVEIFRKRKTRSVSFKAIEKYGNAVVRHLERNGQQALLILSREHTLDFICDFSNYFEVDKPDSANGAVRLKDSRDIEDLVDAFSGRISLGVLEALVDDSTVKVLLEVA